MDDHYKHTNEAKKVKLRNHLLDSKKEKRRWIFLITILSFFLSASLTFISSRMLQGSHILISFTIVTIIIIINIAFDIIGTAVTAADEAPFHAMASRKVYGAKRAIRLVRNADKVSNFCNDVVGDICGVISGAASAYIVLRIASLGVRLDVAVIDILMTGSVAAFTVGGKALGKSIAISESNNIIYRVAIVIRFIEDKLKFIMLKKK